MSFAAKGNLLVARKAKSKAVSFTRQYSQLSGDVKTFRESPGQSLYIHSDFSPFSNPVINRVT